MSKCKNCGRELVNNDVALTKKLLNKSLKEFYCIDCLADKFKCSTELLERKIEHFKNTGCSLFV